MLTFSFPHSHTIYGRFVWYIIDLTVHSWLISSYLAIRILLWRCHVESNIYVWFSYAHSRHLQLLDLICLLICLIGSVHQQYTIWIFFEASAYVKWLSNCICCVNQFEMTKHLTSLIILDKKETISINWVDKNNFAFSLRRNRFLYPFSFRHDPQTRYSRTLGPGKSHPS